MVRLLLTRHEVIKNKHTFDEIREYTIGRNPNSNILIDDEADSGVSYEHAVLTVSQEVKVDGVEVVGCFGTIRDLNSSQGTYLNGLRIASRFNGNALEVPLFEGDTLGLGKEGFRIFIPKRSATMSTSYQEIDRSSGSYLLRGRLIDDNEFGASQRRLLDHFFETNGAECTYEEIYEICHERETRPTDKNNVYPGAESRYCQQLISDLRSIFRTRERYRDFIFRNNRGSYSMNWPEI